VPGANVFVQSNRQAHAPRCGEMGPGPRAGDRIGVKSSMPSSRPLTTHDGRSIEVRLLAAGDLAPYRGLQRLFAEAFEDAASYLSRPPTDAYVHRWLASTSHVALVALADGAVVGGLAAYVLEKFEQERNEVYLYDLAVAEGERRRGIATALIGELRSLARARGAWVLFVQADRGDEPAIRLYASLGRREEVLHFDLLV
jgi:aminoglycoside 3-N-acetyltransferase I